LSFDTFVEEIVELAATRVLATSAFGYGYDAVAAGDGGVVVASVPLVVSTPAATSRIATTPKVLVVKFMIIPSWSPRAEARCGHWR
jgi:hypothetical protein